MDRIVFEKRFKTFRSNLCDVLFKDYSNGKRVNHLRKCIRNTSLFLKYSKQIYSCTIQNKNNKKLPTNSAADHLVNMVRMD